MYTVMIIAKNSKMLFLYNMCNLASVKMCVCVCVCVCVCMCVYVCVCIYVCIYISHHTSMYVTRDSKYDTHTHLA